MDASSASEKEIQQLGNNHEDQSGHTEGQPLKNGGSSALPPSSLPGDEAGAAQINVDIGGDNKNFAQESHIHNANSGNEDAGCDAAQATSDIFSPDTSDIVTVVCKGDGRSDEHDKEGGDGYETHSDSIETLEEDETVHPQQECEGSAGQSDLTTGFSHMRLSNPCQADEEQDVFGNETNKSGSILQQGVGDDPNKTDRPERSDARNDSETSSPSAPNRPESLSLPRPLQYYERKRSSTSGDVQKNTSQTPPSGGHQRSRSEAMDIEKSSRRLKGDLGCGDDVMSTSLPHGTILRKGEMIEFVADDLTEKIKRSSPMSTSRADSSSMGSRRSSQRSIASCSSSATSTSVTSGVSRSPSSLLTQSPDAAPPIDPGAVMELEMASRRVADSVDIMMGNLRNNLHKMSAITVGCSEAYKTSVDITCDSVDSSIKSMYALMAKCEELSATMGPLYQLGTQIKEIKRLLDLFESQLTDKS